VRSAGRPHRPRPPPGPARRPPPLLPSLVPVDRSPRIHESGVSRASIRMRPTGADRRLAGVARTATNRPRGGRSAADRGRRCPAPSICCGCRNKSRVCGAPDAPRGRPDAPGRDLTPDGADLAPDGAGLLDGAQRRWKRSGSRCRRREQAPRPDVAPDGAGLLDGAQRRRKRSGAVASRCRCRRAGRITSTSPRW
jgi:hypothetical protein